MSSGRIERIYLDVCSLCRPYDDQSDMRVRFETDAIFMIMEEVRCGRYVPVFSPIHEQEIAGIPDVQEQAEILSFLEQYGKKTGKGSPKLRTRADELVTQGLGIADAAHLAFAEARSDALVSCDDKFVRRAKKLSGDFGVMNLVEFCQEEKL